MVSLSPKRPIQTTGLLSQPQQQGLLGGYGNMIAGLLSGLGGGLASYGAPGGISQGFQQGLGNFQNAQWNNAEMQRQNRRDTLEEQRLQMEVEEAQREADENAQLTQQLTSTIEQLNLPPDMKAIALTGVAQDPKGILKMIGDFVTPQSPGKPNLENAIFGDQTQTGYLDENGNWVGIGDPGPRFAKQLPTIIQTGGSGGAAELGLQLQYAVGPDGKVHAYQVSKSGGIQEVPLPEGMNWAPQTQFLDTGTGFVGVDKRTPGAPGTTIAKDVAGAEEQKKLGEGLGTAQVNLPNAEASADLMLGLIDSIDKDPNKSIGTGLTALGNAIPATPGYDFQQKVNQVEGQAFLTAFESLKGGGQITQIEGEKATVAIARLKTAQSEKAFDAALNDLKSVVINARNRARTKAGVSTPDNDPLGIRD